MSQVCVKVNGEERYVESGSTLRALLRMLEIPPKNIGIECNGEFLKPADALDRVLEEGDRIELIRFVGGG